MATLSTHPTKTIYRGGQHSIECDGINHWQVNSDGTRKLWGLCRDWAGGCSNQDIDREFGSPVVADGGTSLLIDNLFEPFAPTREAS